MPLGNGPLARLTPGFHPTLLRLAGWDDDFESGVLLAKWTAITSAQTNVLSFSGGKITIQGATNNKHVYGIRQAAPTGSFTVKAQLQQLSANSNDLRNGVFVAIPGSKAHVCGPFVQDNNFGAIGVTTASDSADWSGYDGFLANVTGSIGNLTWFRIVWDSGTSILTFQYSSDGTTWSTITTRSSMSQPTEVGICEYSNSGAIQTTGSITCAEFRVTQP